MFRPLALLSALSLGLWVGGCGHCSKCDAGPFRHCAGGSCGSCGGGACGCASCPAGGTCTAGQCGLAGCQTGWVADGTGDFYYVESGKFVGWYLVKQHKFFRYDAVAKSYRSPVPFAPALTTPAVYLAGGGCAGGSCGR